MFKTGEHHRVSKVKDQHFCKKKVKTIVYQTQ